MTVLLLRLDAPLMSFGGPMVDHNGVVQTFPGLSMLTGLLANALGWHHADAERLETLQQALRYAARIDRVGERIVDYQTVDLGQDWMLHEKAGWTTRGAIQERDGGNFKGTHQRLRHYQADTVCTVALTTVGTDAPSIDAIAAALHAPARPLFLGRKCCLPAAPVLLALVQAASLVTALADAPRSSRADVGPLLATWFADDEPSSGGASVVIAVSDERDWRHGVHVGRRLMRQGRVNPPEAGHV